MFKHRHTQTCTCIYCIKQFRNVYRYTVIYNKDNMHLRCTPGTFTIGEVVVPVLGEVLGVEARVTARGGGSTADRDDGVGALVVLVHVVKRRHSYRVPCTS